MPSYNSMFVLINNVCVWSLWADASNLKCLGADTQNVSVCQLMHILALITLISVLFQMSNGQFSLNIQLSPHAIKLERRAYAHISNESTHQYCAVNTSDTLLFIILSLLDILVYFSTLPFHLSLLSKLKTRQDRTLGRVGSS